MCARHAAVLCAHLVAPPHGATKTWPASRTRLRHMYVTRFHIYVICAHLVALSHGATKTWPAS
jgi:hypothetical protein